MEGFVAFPIVTAYPGWHCRGRMAFRTKIQMQDNDGAHNGKDADARNEREIYHYTHNILAFKKV